MSACSLRRTVFRTTAPPTARLTTNPVRAGSRDPGRTSRCPVSRGRPVRLPLRTAAEKSSRRRIRAAAGSTGDLPGPRPGPAGQILIRARPLRRRADRIARPALVRMRSRNPCVLARRRLFGWNVRLLTGTPGTDHHLGLGPREGDSAQAGLTTVEVAGSAYVTRTPGHRSNQRAPAHLPEPRVCRTPVGRGP